MKALVTGATGFVGRHLVRALLAAGDTVTALVRSPERARVHYPRDVRLAPGDLGNMEALRSAVPEQDVIYHVAGLIAARSEAEFLSVNRDGTARLLEAASEAGRPRIVLVSSLAAAGPTARGTRLAGSEEARPVSAYGRSKLAGERVVRRGALPWTIVRPPAVYGPYDAEILRVFRAIKYGVAPVFGDGAQEISMIYGPDLGAALAAAGRSEAAVGRVFYACHPEVLTTGGTVRKIAAAMHRSVRVLPLPRWLAETALAVTSSAARLTGRATLLTRDKANELFAPAWTCDSGPLSEATGWRAEHDLASGAAATAAWYRDAGLL
ncbi:MAG TPA: NAD-dependent epimerase/dehydratase family protein [Gemmatimonadales bacterium]